MSTPVQAGDTLDIGTVTRVVWSDAVGGSGWYVWTKHRAPIHVGWHEPTATDGKLDRVTPDWRDGGADVLDRARCR